jgi:hypothetical protein
LQVVEVEELVLQDKLYLEILAEQEEMVQQIQLQEFQ